MTIIIFKMLIFMGIAIFIFFAVNFIGWLFDMDMPPFDNPFEDRIEFLKKYEFSMIKGRYVLKSNFERMVIKE